MSARVCSSEVWRECVKAGKTASLLCAADLGERVVATE